MAIFVPTEYRKQRKGPDPYLNYDQMLAGTVKTGRLIPGMTAVVNGKVMKIMKVLDGNARKISELNEGSTGGLATWGLTKKEMKNFMASTNKEIVFDTTTRAFSPMMAFKKSIIYRYWPSLLFIFLIPFYMIDNGLISQSNIMPAIFLIIGFVLIVVIDKIIYR